MSMPQYLDVAVVAYEDQQSAATVTALLGGPGSQGIAPYVVSLCVLPGGRIPSPLIEAGRRHGLTIAPGIRMALVNPRLMDLWLCLDARAEAEVRQHVQTYGPAPQGFYRQTFPDPVVSCGFPVPAPPEGQASHEAWLLGLKGLFGVWKDRILQAFYDSS
jgi:hypothetical protein